MVFGLTFGALALAGGGVSFWTPFIAFAAAGLTAAATTGLSKLVGGAWYHYARVALGRIKNGLWVEGGA